MNRPFTGVGGTPEPAPGVVVTDLLPPNPLWASNGCAFGPDGRLWIAQFLGGTVSALDLATGELETVLGPDGPLTAPDDLAFDDDGSCYVVDLPPGLVWRRAPDGTTTVVADGIVAPDGIAVHRGRLFVNELAPGGRLLEILPDEHPVRVMAKGLALGNAMAVGPDGRLVYPHLYGGEVWAVDLDGGTPERLLHGLDRPVAVRFDHAGRMLVLSNADGSVLVAGDGAQPSSTRVDGGRVETGVVGADNLAVGPDGTWYVTGAFTGGLVALAPDGSRRQLLPPGLCGPFGLASLGGRLFAADHHSLAELVDGGVHATEVGVHGLRGLAAVGSELVTTTEGGEVWRGAPDGPFRKVASGLDGPAGLVDAPDGLLIAESGAGRVVRPDGEVVADGLDTPADLATDGDEVWCTDAARGQVVRLRDGAVLAAGLARPEGLVAHDGSLLVVEAAAGRLTRVDPRTRRATAVVVGLPLASLPAHVPPAGSGTGAIAQRPAPLAGLTLHDGAVVVGLTGTGGALRAREH